MKNSRIEKLRKARSFNEVVSIIKEIAQSIKSNGIVADRLVASLSKTSLSGRTRAPSTIEIDHTGEKEVESPIKMSVRTTKGAKISAKLIKFVVPKADVLKKNNDVLTALYQNVLELDAAEALVRQSFHGQKNQPATLKAIGLLKKEVDAKLDVAFGALSDLADKHLPTEMENLGEKMDDFLADTFSDDKRSKYVYVVPGEDKDIIFSYYICIDEVKSSSGFVFDNYYVVLTGVVQNGFIKYYVNALPDFKAPGRYPKGMAVTTEADLKHNIKMLFAHNDIAVEMERRPMPIDTERAKAGLGAIEGVQAVKVEDDMLMVLLKNGSQDNINNVLTKLLPRLNGLVGNKTRKSVITKRITKNNAGKTILKFILTPNQKTKNVTHIMDLEQLNEVQKMLGLTDRQVKQIKEAQLNEE